MTPSNTNLTIYSFVPQGDDRWSVACHTDIEVNHRIVTQRTDYSSASIDSNNRRENRSTTRNLAAAAANIGLSSLFASSGSRILSGDGVADLVRWKNDGITGRPFLEWSDRSTRDAIAVGLEPSHIHVSNSHDGDLQTVIVAGADSIVGIGIDIVYLPRIARKANVPGYLLRLASMFAAPAELEQIRSHLVGRGEADHICIIALYFSLMEAASKALGVGLRMGLGMGRSASVPKRSIEVDTDLQSVCIQFVGQGRDAYDRCGAVSTKAVWSVDGDYLLSLVVLER